jgi:hypothetical protein
MTERQRTARIPALGSDGQCYEVLEYTELPAVSRSSPQTRAIPGLKSYWIHARPLNQVDADTWRTIDGSLTLYRMRQ